MDTAFTLQRGHLKLIRNVTERRIDRELRRLWSAGPTSSATLTSPSGDLLQVGGGRVTCVLERWDSVSKRRLRAWQDKIVVPWEDGVLLPISAGAVPMKRQEWLRIEQVIEAFLSFLHGRSLPDHLHWRDVTCEPNIEHPAEDPARKWA